MKILLLVITSIICLLAILLLLPILVDFKYEDRVFLKIKYAGITVFNNTKQKKAKSNIKNQKENNKKTVPSKDGFLKRTYKQKGLTGTVKYFSDIFTVIFKKLFWVLKYIKFKNFYLDLTVATNDAADTAIQYGEICCALYPLLSFLQTKLNFKAKQININANFEKTKYEVNTSVLVSANVIVCIITTVGLLLEILKIQRKESEKNERK